MELPICMAEKVALGFGPSWKVIISFERQLTGRHRLNIPTGCLNRYNNAIPEIISCKFVIEI